MTLLSEPAAVAGVVSAIGGGLTAALTFFATRRKYSGTVATSDAEQLWAQVSEHLKRLDATVSRQDLVISQQGTRIAELGIELHQKDERIIHLESVNGRLSVRVSELETELEKVKDRERRVAETLADKEERAAG